jgi:hypothetical protein
MDILTSIPVRVNRSESTSRVLENVRERISQRAYENFVERGYVDGYDLDDWLTAERELIIKSNPVVGAQGEDIFVEMMLPEIDLANLTVHVAARQLVISSDPDEDGLQLCQVIDLPYPITPDGVDAEQMQNVLQIAAAIGQAESQRV